MGFLDSILGSNDQSTADPNNGLTDFERRQAAFSTLGSTGALLLAAGQNMLPQQRAQILSQLGTIPAQTQEQVSAMARTKLLNQQGQIAKQNAAKQATLEKQLASPEFAAQLANLPPELKAAATAAAQAGDIGTLTKLLSQNSADTRQQAQFNQQSEIQQRQFAQQLAMQQQQAQATLRSAPPTVTHDANGQPIAYNRATGGWAPIGPQADPRAAYGLPPAPGTPPVAQPPSAPSADGIPPQSVLRVNQPQVGGLNPAQATIAAPPPVPDQFPNASIDRSVDYSRPWGVGGATASLGGTGQDLVFGKMSPDNQSVAQAAANYNQVRAETIKALSVDVPGRATKYTTGMIADLLPESNSLFTGKSEAVSKLDSAGRMLDSEIQNLETAFASPGNIAARGKIAANLKELYRARDNLGVVSQGLVKGMQGGKPPAAKAPPPDDTYEYRVLPNGQQQRRPRNYKASQ